MEIKKLIDEQEIVRFAYVKLMDEEGWFQGQTYVDTMNPEAIDCFINETHEAYYQAIGNEFGKTVPAIFTDEPRIGKQLQLTTALSHEDISVPYTENFAKQMNQKYDIDPIDIIPEFIWEVKKDGFSINRYLYRKTLTECFASTFMDRLGNWCKLHNIKLTGHVLSESPLTSQVVCVGDTMRNYKKMDIPGVDMLVDRRELVTVKQATSVTKQYGRSGTVSELYGGTHWYCDFKTYKLQGDWQVALGITIRVPHLSFMSMAGEAKRDWPASIFYQSPWYEEFSSVEDHFARLNTVLTRGQAVTKIAVVHPVESCWLHFGPNDQTATIRKEMDNDFENLTNWLLYGTLDFDYLSESLLFEQCMNFMNQPTNKLFVGEMEYTTVIVPNMETIRSTTLDILEKFHEYGGKVLFIGKVPHLVDAKESKRAKKMAETCQYISKSQDELYKALNDERDLMITKNDGTRANNLFLSIAK